MLKIGNKYISQLVIFVYIFSFYREEKDIPYNTLDETVSINRLSVANYSRPNHRANGSSVGQKHQ